MKRYIHTSADYNHLHSYKEAEAILDNYSKEQVDYVRNCYNDVLDEISKLYEENEKDDDFIGVSISGIKTDWLIGAIEDDLMEEEEFEEIYRALETLGERDAMAYA